MSIGTPPDFLPPPESAAAAKLIVLSGPHKGAVHVLPPRGEFSIGRAESNDLTLPDGEVSRTHCKVVIQDGRYRLRDLGSTNGTFVDRRRVIDAPLDSGAKIHLGRTELVLVLPDETRAVAAVSVAEAGERAAAPEPRPATRRRSRRPVLGVAAATVLGVVAAVLVWSGTRGGLLPRRMRTLSVTSDPAGTEVFLDDRFIGTTPLEIEVTAGDPHALRLIRRGHLAWRTAIGPDTPSRISARLLPEPAATLLITASPSGAEVWLDGLFVGKTGDDPLRVSAVKLGQHELRLTRPNYLTAVRPVSVTRAATLRIHVPLESRQESSLLGLLAKDPKSARLYTELGHLYMVEKQLDKAMGAYKKALELVYSGEDTSGYSRRLGQEFQKVIQGYRGIFRYGNKEETEVACEKLEDVLVSLAGRYPRVQSQVRRLAAHYRRIGRPDSAVRLYRKLLAAQPDRPDLYYQVAALCIRKNDYEGAVAVLRDAAARFPDSWQVHYRLGQAYRRRSESDRSAEDRRLAVLHLRKALGLCPSSAYRRNIQSDLVRAQNLKP